MKNNSAEDISLSHHQHHVMQGCLRLDENANIIIPSMIYDCEIDNGSTLITSLAHDTVRTQTAHGVPASAVTKDDA